jgi:cob(I)alamin adenosyltransferase
MKIYTKTGDKGTTALFGGTRVAKHHIRIESYGTVDELNSHIGLIRDQEIDVRSKEILIHIQDRLFTLGAILATDPEKTILKSGKERLNIPKIKEDDILLLVCRRAERLATLLNEQEPTDEQVLKYLNRLSDYLFVLARKLTYHLQAEEILWVPKKL